MRQTVVFATGGIATSGGEKGACERHAGLEVRSRLRLRWRPHGQKHYLHTAHFVADLSGLQSIVPPRGYERRMRSSP